MKKVSLTILHAFYNYNNDKSLAAIHQYEVIFVMNSQTTYLSMKKSIDFLFLSNQFMDNSILFYFPVSYLKQITLQCDAVTI